MSRPAACWRTAGRTARRHRRRARARRASPTGRSSAPRWPTATSELAGVPAGDDTVAMVRCLAALGVGDRRRRRAGRGDRHRRAARARRRRCSTPASPARPRGSSPPWPRSRPRPVTIDGGPPLRARPMGPLHDALRALGATVDDRPSRGRLPVTVAGPLRRRRHGRAARRRVEPVPHGADADRPAARRRPAPRADDAARLGAVRRADGAR